jgi:Transposase and inactivated derivatives
MLSYRQIFYHIIFRTRSTRKTLNLNECDDLYKHIKTVIKNKHSVLYCINGTEDHIHFLSDLHPSVALADFIREIKSSAGNWIENNGQFPEFDGWANGYVGLTYNYVDKERIIDYIKNQRELHKTIDLELECRKVLEKHGIEIGKDHFL